MTGRQMVADGDGRWYHLGVEEVLRMLLFILGEGKMPLRYANLTLGRVTPHVSATPVALERRLVVERKTI